MAEPKFIKRKIIDTSSVVAFILSLIVLFVSLIASYVSISNINDKQQKIDEIRNEISQQSLTKLTKSKDNYFNLSRLVGWQAGKGQNENKDSQTNPANLKETLNKWATILKEKYQIDKYGLWDKHEEAKERLNIKKLLDELKGLIDTCQLEIHGLVSQRSELWDKEKTLVGTPTEDGQIPKLEKEKSQEINLLLPQCAEVETRIKDIIRRGETEIESLTTQIKQLSDEITKLSKENEPELAKLEREKIDYEQRLQKIQERIELAKEGLEQDGEIIVSDPQAGYVYINLGRKHAIFAGMEFEVFTILKGGLKKDKGKVNISKLYDDYSECTVIPGSTDPLDPIVAGDYVNCRIYSRDKAKKFVFTGKPIGRYPLAELKTKIQEFGGQVLDEVSPDVAYLIVGDGYDKDPIYEKALYLGIVVLREKELYDLIGLAWQ